MKHDQCHYVKQNPNYQFVDMLQDKVGLGKIPFSFLALVNLDENDIILSVMAMVNLEETYSGPKWWTNL